MDSPPERYTDMPTNLPDPMTRLSRSAFIISLIVAAISLLAVLHDIFQIVRMPSWELAAVIGSSSVLCLLAVSGAFLSRKGNSTAAGWAVILGISQMLFTRSFLLVSESDVVGLAGLLLIFFIAVRTLKQLQVRWAAFVGIIVLVATRLLGAASPLPQIQIRAIDLASVIVAWCVLVLMSFLLVREFRSLALTNKLVLTFIIMAIVVTFATNYFNQVRTEQVLTERAGLGLFSLANNQAQAVGDVLNAELDALTSISLGSLMQRAVDAENRTYVSNPVIIFDRLTTIEKRWSDAIQAKDFLRTVITSRLENEIADELMRFVSIFPLNLQMILTDMHGGLIAATTVDTDYYQGDEYWWKTTSNNGKGIAYISLPMHDSKLQENVIAIAIPVVDRETGSTIGILRSTYSLAGVEGILQSMSLGTTGRADIFIPSGPTFPSFPSGPTQILQNGQLVMAETTVLDTLAGMVNQPYGEITYQEIPNFTSIALIKPVRSNPLVENLSWRLVVYQEKNETLAPVVEQTQQAGFLSALIVGLVSALAILLSQFLAGPIVRLTQTAEQVRSGDLTARAAVETDDEVGNLAASFNSMTAQLRQMLAQLEHRVYERTRELALAGEVGRELSQERVLDRLLHSAVDMIQSSFNLYYTQIYLLDSSGKSLILRSGAGEVGDELLRRSHRLLIGSGSINGSAAFENRPIIVADVAKSPIFRSNPLLPHTLSEMAVPLRLGERVVGVLDMQSSDAGTFTEESLPAFEALAGQLAVAVENANLFEQAQAARQELESQARRLTREGWVEFLDAVEQKERIGFAYDRRNFISYDEPITSTPISNQPAEILTVPLQVTGESMGAIQLEKEADLNWTEEEQGLVNSVAVQVARQIDNLRLLAQAEKFRQEAETSARRLTRAGWEEYLGSFKEREISLAYDRLQVSLEPSVGMASDEPELSQAIAIRGEVIGDLSLQGISNLDEDSMLLIQTITDRLAVHIENLRLSAKTQQALLETEALYTIIARINAARDYEEILKTFLDHTILGQSNRLAVIGVFDKALGGSESPNWIFPVASRSDGKVEIAARYPFDVFEGIPDAIFTDRPVVLNNLNADDRLDPMYRMFFHQDSPAGSSIIVSLVLGSFIIGFVQGYYDTPVDFPEAQLQRLLAVAGQAAIAVQSMLLLEQAQARARQEQRIREVTAQVFSAADIDSIMRKTVEQVGRALGTPAYIYLSQDRSPQGIPEPRRIKNDGNSVSRSASR